MVLSEVFSFLYAVGIQLARVRHSESFSYLLLQTSYILKTQLSLDLGSFSKKFLGRVYLH